MVNGLLTDCPGLIHGKTGIAVFFFHYYRYTENKLFEEYAFELLCEIQKQLHCNSSVDYRTGIAGIGVGIDYLLKNRFLVSDNDVFEDIDKRMYNAVMYDFQPDFSLYDGITGYGRYWLSRLNQESSSGRAKECILRIINYIGEKKNGNE